MVGHWNRLYLAYTPTRKRSGIIVAESSFIHVRMGRERQNESNSENKIVFPTDVITIAYCTRSHQAGNDFTSTMYVHSYFRSMNK